MDRKSQLCRLIFSSAILIDGISAPDQDPKSVELGARCVIFILALILTDFVASEIAIANVRSVGMGMIHANALYPAASKLCQCNVSHFSPNLSNISYRLVVLQTTATAAT